MKAYCLGCRHKVDIQNPVAAYNKIGVPVVTGRCVAGHKVYVTKRIPAHDEIEPPDRPKRKEGERNYEGRLLSELRKYGKKPVDYQKDKLYSAEDALLLTKGKGIEFETVEEIQNYVLDIGNTVWWKNRAGFGKIKVLTHHGVTSYGNRIMRYIKLSSHDKWAWNELFVLHELTHVMMSSYYEPSHGRLFAKSYLDILEWKLGKDWKKALKEQYRTHGVKYYKARGGFK